MWVSSLSEDDSILLRHMDDVVDTGPDKCHRHRAIREMDNQMNQHIEMPQIQYTDKVADKSIAVQRQVFAENHLDQGTLPASVTSKAKPLPNTARPKGRIR